MADSQGGGQLKKEELNELLIRHLTDEATYAVEAAETAESARLAGARLQGPKHKLYSY